MASMARLEQFGIEILHNEPLKKHTSFKVGGPAEYFARPTTIIQLGLCWAEARTKKIPITILGDGTNVLVSDKGIPGMVISTNLFKDIFIQDNQLMVMAGARLSKVAEEACKAGLAGLEFASGIPGTMGGAVYMNAGAYGSEIGDFVVSGLLVDQHLDTIELSRDEMKFGYRSSYMQALDALVLQVKLELTPGDPVAIRDKMNGLNAKRKASQPLNMPSAGSTFKRPEGNFAGSLIEKSGLKGVSIGGAQISEKHAGFIVNTGDATAKDIFDLILKVRHTVYSQHGITLEPEVRLLGDF